MRREDEFGPDDREPRPDDHGSEERRGVTVTRSGFGGRQILIGVFAIILIVFAIANFDRVEVHFLLFQTRARVITVVAVAGALGFLIGYLVGRPTREQRRFLRKHED